MLGQILYIHVGILCAPACRELTHYKGDPDPFKGDVLNQKVRDAAKETLDAIFQATDTNYSSTSSKPTLTVMLTAGHSTIYCIRC